MSVEIAGLRELVDRTVVSAAGHLPAPLVHLLAGHRPSVGGGRLHAEHKLVLDLFRLSGAPSYEMLSVAEARAQLATEARNFAGRPVAVAEVRHLEIPGPGGDIPARLYTPRATATPMPLLVFFHGGGFVVGDLESHDNVCRFLAVHGDCKVLSVDYRLAPEHPFPAAPYDSFAAFCYAESHAAELGVDPDAIAVGGDSAGGNLAAVVCLMARDHGGAQPAFQLLFVPATDLSTKRPSVSLFSEGYLLTESLMDWYFACYLENDSDAYSPLASPMLASSHAGLPPAYIATAGFDPLRDDGAEYARRLQDAGVPVVHRLHSGFVHPFANAVGFGRASRAALLEATSALRTGVAFARAKSRVFEAVPEIPV